MAAFFCCKDRVSLASFAAMPRAHRLQVEGGIFHLTHRCHNRAFLLKFARDRDRYRAGMREALQQFDMSLLDYCLTCNHVHLLVEAQDRLEVSAFMRKVAGEFALDYNKRKGRLNAFWGDNFHATLVESGQYLWRCLQYIELNMVRCGKVSHPRQWEWVGYHEIMGPASGIGCSTWNGYVGVWGLTVWRKSGRIWIGAWRRQWRGIN